MNQPAIHADSPRFDSQATPTALPSGPHRLPGAHLPHHHAHKPGILHPLQSLLYIIVVAIFIITFCVQPFRIPSGSMESTLLVGDFLLVNKQRPLAGNSNGLLPSSAIHRGDIVVFHYPVDPSLHLIKRVIGMPGDHIRLHDSHVYINGTALVEPYAVYRPGPPDSFRDNFPRLRSADPDIDSRWWIRMRKLIDNGDLIVPADNYFVLGDNRNNSEDSRYWGFVPRSAIVGEPLLIYFSLQQSTDEATSTLARTSATTRNPILRHTGPIDTLADFARWSRTLQVVR